MGLGGISMWQLLIILLIVVLIFGTKRLKGMGKDLGGAVKGFKDAIDDDKSDHETADNGQHSIEQNNNTMKTEKNSELDKQKTSDKSDG